MMQEAGTKLDPQHLIHLADAYILALLQVIYASNMYSRTAAMDKLNEAGSEWRAARDMCGIPEAKAARQ